MATETKTPVQEDHTGTYYATELQRDEDEIPVSDLLIGLVQRKRLIFSITTVFAILAIVVSLLLPKQYTAVTVVLPPQQNTGMGALLSSQLGSIPGMAALAGGSLGLKNPNDMFIGMLKSRTVEDAMIQRYGLMAEYHKHYISDARKVFERKATVDGSGKDGLIHIAVEDSDPVRAAELANGYVDQFRKLSEHLAITEASQRRLFFEQQLEDAKNKLAAAEEAMKKTEQTTGLIQLDSQARALIESAVSLRAQIAAKEVQIQSLQTFATDQNPQLVQAQKELESLRAQLAKLGGSEGLSEESLIVPKGRVPEAGLEYVRKLRDVKYYETIFEILARQFEMAKLDEAKQGALIQVVDSAVPPDKRSFPKPGLIVAVSTVVGLLVGILTGLLQLAFQRMRNNENTRRKLEEFRRALSFKQR